MQLATASEVPGALGLAWNTLSNPVSNQPLAIIRNGARAGTKLVGSAAVRAAGVATAKVAAVSVAGLELGIGIGSVGVGIAGCVGGE
jgi:hypothetical protein